MNIKMLKAALAGLVLSVSGFANAGLITSDFRTESDLPDYGIVGPLVYQNIAQSIGAGYELDSGDFLENPDSWGGGVVWLDYDISTGILLLDSQDDWDFQTFDAYMSNITFDIVGEYISGINLISNDLTADFISGASILPSLSFTDNSIHISYNGDFDFTGETASFQIMTSVAKVPEPSTLAIFALGIMGLASRRFKKQ